MNAAWPQPNLRNLKASAFAEQHVACWHTHIIETKVHVSVRSIVFTEHFHWPKNLDSWGVHGHQDLRVTTMRWRIWACLQHTNHDLAAWVACARDVILLAVNQPLVAVEHCAARKVLGIR